MKSFNQIKKKSISFKIDKEISKLHAKATSNCDKNVIKFCCHNIIKNFSTPYTQLFYSALCNAK